MSTTVPTRLGYAFKGWAVTKLAKVAVYQAGGTYTLDKKNTLYAVWEETGYNTITFNNNGGSGGPTVQYKPKKETIRLSSDEPTRIGYEFIGWAEESDASIPTYQPDQLIIKDEDKYLYAVWKEAVAEVNGKYYMTLQRAVNYAQTCSNNPTITLIKSINEHISVTEGKFSINTTDNYFWETNGLDCRFIEMTGGEVTLSGNLQNYDDVSLSSINTFLSLSNATLNISDGKILNCAISSQVHCWFTCENGSSLNLFNASLSDFDISNLTTTRDSDYSGYIDSTSTVQCDRGSMDVLAPILVEGKLICTNPTDNSTLARIYGNGIASAIEIAETGYVLLGKEVDVGNGNVENACIENRGHLVLR